MAINDRQKAMLGDAVRHGGVIVIPRELAGSRTLYSHELQSLERQGYLSPPDPAPGGGTFRCTVTPTGRAAFAELQARASAA